MNSSVVRIFRRYFRDGIFTVVSVLSGVLAAVPGIRHLRSSELFFLNYRQANLFVWPFLWFAAGLILYALGIYGGALLIRQLYPRWVPTFEPALLAVAGMIGLLIGCLIQWTAQVGMLSWTTALILGGIGSVLGVLLACRVKYPRALGRKVAAVRVSFPLLLILLNYTGFPGVKATAQSRQQWASRQFSEYDYMVSNFKRCQPVIERVGEVKFVAPTKGVNFVADQGGSGRHGEFTLEVVGSTDTGIAHFDFILSAGSLQKFQFTHQNKTEDLSCFNPG